MTRSPLHPIVHPPLAAIFSAFLSLAALLGAGTTNAADKNTPQTEIEASYSLERLTNIAPGRTSQPNWRDIFVEGSHKFRDRQSVYGGLRQTQRFNLTDNQFYGGFYYPLGATWTSTAEARVSPTHEVLAKYSLGGQIQKLLPQGWVAGVGFRRNEFTDTASYVRTFSLERYWGDFRGAYTLFSGKPVGASSAPAHRFQLDYYYNDVSSVGLSFTNGREVENIGPPTGLLTTDIRSLSLSGRHWFARDWAVTYEALTHRQGAIYRREGLRLGLRYRF